MGCQTWAKELFLFQHSNKLSLVAVFQRWNQWKGMLGVPWLAVSLREWFARTRSTFISKRTSLLRVDRLIRADSLGVTDRPVLDYESWPDRPGAVKWAPDQVMFNRVSPALAVNRLTFNGWTDSGPDWSTAYKRKKEAAVDQVPAVHRLTPDHKVTRNE